MHTGTARRTGSRWRRRAWLAGLACSTAALACAPAPSPGATPAAGTAPGSSPVVAPIGPGGSAPRRGDAVTRPTVRGPVTGGRTGSAFGAMPPALADRYGYVEEEYFLSGTATAYAPVGEPARDGRWQVAPATQAPYTTRVLVRRPADRARFDGTALVEWLNVTSGQESDVVFAHAHDELLAHGTVWVGVSAQAVGIQGGGASMSLPGLVATPLKTWDPDRYGALEHPGDDYSYDIFSQVAAVLRRADGLDVLGGGHLTALIGAGESQSAARMVTYADAIQPVAAIYDGFLVHSRGAGGALLHAGAPNPPVAEIRDDLGVPVLQFETETDLFGLSFVTARQPDTDALRTWEVAGTAHLDRDMLDYFGAVRAAASPGTTAGTAPPATRGAEPPDDPLTAACGPVNAGPMSAVLSRAVADLRTWANHGPAPAHGAPLEVADGAITRDEHGVARGGVRTPPVDAPTAVLSGDNASGGGYLCSLFGSTTALGAGELAALYPDHDSYVAAVTRSAREAVARGHLLPGAADAFVEDARRSPIGT